MWHEARRQERKIRGMLVDYRKRAERRRDFYEKIKADPTQFLQIHGRQCKIHLDPAIAAAADSAVMMPWQGQSDNLIDRFDVRAHLDYIPLVKKEEEQEVTQEERHLNYERYRIIAQNSFLGISEEKFLKQLHLEEQFGYTESKTKKEPKATGAAIGFDYEEGTAITQPITNSVEENDSDDNSCDSDLDVDLAINVSKIDSLQAHEMNKHGRNFGMAGNDFYSFLTDDMEEAESYRLAKEEEHEKALFSGRKSRRERRAHREKRLANRVLSPPSYAARESPTYPQLKEESKSPSRTPSPENSGKITYITSFGDDEEPSGSKPTYADKVKYGRPKKKTPSSERIVFYDNERKGSFSRDVTFDRRKKFNSRSRSRSTSKSRSRRRRSRSRSRRRSMSNCSRSRSRSRGSRNKNRSNKRSRSKSRERHSYTRSVKSYRRRSPSSSSCSSAASKASKHQSVSPPKPSILAPKLESPPKVVTRYYGRRKSDISSSESSDSDDEINKDVEMKATYNSFSSEASKSGSNNTGTSFKKSTASLTVREKLKRKRQALLNKQFKKDKIAEELKAEREKQEQQMREDELREIAIKLRRKQREKRHAYESSHSSSRSSSCSESSSTQEEAKPESEPESPRSKSKERESRRHDRKERRGSRDRDDRGRGNHRDRSDTRRDRERKRERSYSPRGNRDRELGKEREKRDNSGNSREKKLVDY